MNGAESEYQIFFPPCKPVGDLPGPAPAELLQPCLRFLGYWLVGLIPAFIISFAVAAGASGIASWNSGKPTSSNDTGWVAFYWALALYVAALPIGWVVTVIQARRDTERSNEWAWRACQDSKRQQDTQYESQCAQHRQLCLGIVERLRKLQQVLPSLLDSAASSVREARKEYDQNAFRVMFNYVESAYRDLEQFNLLLREIAAKVPNYEEMLSPYRHTFPAVAPPPKELSSAAQTVASSLAAVTRLADTNPTCTAIWLQIETVEVMRAGFASVSRAVEAMGDQITGAIEAMSDQLTESMSTLGSEVREEIRSEGSRTTAELRDIGQTERRAVRAINVWGVIHTVELERIHRAVTRR